MADKLSCPVCHKPVAAGLIRCPFCQAEFDPAFLAASQATAKKSRNVAIGCAAVLGFFVLLVAIADPPKQDAAQVAPSATASPVASSGPPKPGSASAEMRSAVLGFRANLMAAMEPCDAAGKRNAEVAQQLGQSTSIYDGYASAKAMSESCNASWLRIRSVDVPGRLSGEAEDKAEETIARCSDAAFAKKRGADAMMKVFDGDMRPSAIEEAKSLGSDAQTLLLGCVAGIFGVANAAGVDFEDLAE